MFFLFGSLSLRLNRPLFNVDSTEVAERIVASCVPTYKWHTTVCAKPDLYGLVWITTTLVFALSVVGNVAKWLTFKATSDVMVWIFDFTKVFIHSLVLIISSTLLIAMAGHVCGVSALHLCYFDSLYPLGIPAVSPNPLSHH